MIRKNSTFCVLFLVSSVLLSIQARPVLSAPGYKASRYINSEFIKELLVAYKANCINIRRYGDIECSRYASIFIIYYYNMKEYTKAETYLPELYKGSIQSSRKIDCPYNGFSPKAFNSDDVFFVHYSEAAYAIFSKTNKAKAKKHAVRAFMCARDEFRSNPNTISGDKMGRSEFVSAIKALFGSNPAYDVNRIIDDVINPIDDRTKELRNGKKWGSNDDEDARDAVQLSALLENSIEYMQREKIGIDFINYYKDVKGIYDNNVTVNKANKIMKQN